MATGVRRQGAVASRRLVRIGVNRGCRGAPRCYLWAMIDAPQRNDIDDMFVAWDRPQSPGVVFGVFEHGAMVHSGGYGAANLDHDVPITRDTVFHIASLSKQFTALIAAMVTQTHGISLDTDLRRVVPELPPGPSISFAHAIHHVSGLREQWDLLRLAGWRDADLKTTDDVLRIVRAQRGSNFAPGTRFQYINTAYTLIAVAIERIAGETFRQIADRLIFAPLGMRDTFFLDDQSAVIPRRSLAYATRGGRHSVCVPHFETVGPSNLHSTLNDLAKWEANLVSPTVGDPALLAAMTEPAAFAEGARTDYGYGLILGHHGVHRTVEHAGGDAAFRAYYLRIPAERFAVIVLANFLDISPSHIARAIVDLCLPQPGGAAACSSTAPLDLKLHHVDRLGGLYRHDDSGVTCRVDLSGGRLHLASSGAEYELVPLQNGNFQFRDMDIEVAFDLPESAPAKALSVHAGGNTINVCARVDPAEDSEPSRLDDYAGAYRSAELDATYRLAPRGTLLIVRGPRGLAIRLRRVHGDGFAALDTTIDVQFQRGDDGAVNGLLLSSERAWNIAFTRVAATS
jgi:CubicO group peptidase (beta-lactamase class C family)